MLNKVTKKVTKEVDVTVQAFITCDVCGNKLNYNSWYNDTKRAAYYEVMTGHRDWGNDSCDSIKHHDICSDECLSRFTQKWLKDANGSTTAYINIEKETHILDDGEEE